MLLLSVTSLSVRQWEPLVSNEVMRWGFKSLCPSSLRRGSTELYSSRTGILRVLGHMVSEEQQNLEFVAPGKTYFPDKLPRKLFIRDVHTLNAGNIWRNGSEIIWVCLLVKFCSLQLHIAPLWSCWVGLTQ